MYYIVRRAFRNKTGPLPVGSIVEPTGVANFKYRLGEKHVVLIDEQNYERYASLFLDKFGITIPPVVEPEKSAETTKTVEPVEPVKPAEPMKPAEPPEPVKPTEPTEPAKPTVQPVVRPAAAVVHAVVR